MNVGLNLKSDASSSLALTYETSLPILYGK
jgi:hypothetical protein